MKSKILFVVHQLNYGGVQKALLTALDAIDYNQNEVTLYIRKNRTELLPIVNASVNRIIINKDAHHYYRSLDIICDLVFAKAAHLLGFRKREEALQAGINEKITARKMTYEKNAFFSDQIMYDVAVSYIQGNTARFVAECVPAKKKLMFFHGSVDESHELHERVLPAFDAIVGVNSRVGDLLKALYPTQKDHVTYLDNYVDASAIRAASEAFAADRREKRLVLCSCGRLSTVKGFDLAVEAARILKERSIDFLWYFVGDGPERKALESQIAANDLKDHVIITGMQENPYPWMKACDIYVQSSREEAQPLTIIESKILCRPIVSTKTVGGLSLVEDGTTGLLTDIAGDAIADGVMRLVASPDLYDRIGRNLEAIDYSEDFARYQQAWAALLEGKL